VGMSTTLYEIGYATARCRDSAWPYHEAFRKAYKKRRAYG
jgi:hypothetical protein